MKSEIEIEGLMSFPSEGGSTLKKQKIKIVTGEENKNPEYIFLSLIGILDNSATPIAIHKDDLVKVLKFLTREEKLNVININIEKLIDELKISNDKMSIEDAKKLSNKIAEILKNNPSL